MPQARSCTAEENRGGLLLLHISNTRCDNGDALIIMAGSEASERRVARSTV